MIHAKWRARMVVLMMLAVQVSPIIADDAKLVVERAPDVIDEPMHSEIFRNSTIRVYAATIPGRSSTLFHRHTLSGVGIDMTPNRLAIEKIGSERSEFTTVPADFFPVKVVEPYVHRIINLDETPYMTLVAERLEGKQLGREASSLNAVAGVKFEVETDLVRAFRFVLRPGESTPTHTVGVNTLMVALSGGLISVRSDSGHEILQSVAPGQLTWIATPLTTKIFNAGVTEYSVAYLEWK